MNFLQKLKNVFVKSVSDTSDAGKVNQTDAAKVVKTGVLVGIAAAISSILTSISPDMLGQYQPLIVLGLTIALDFINKLVKSNKG